MVVKFYVNYDEEKVASIAEFEEYVAGRTEELLDDNMFLDTFLEDYSPAEIFRMSDEDRLALHNEFVETAKRNARYDMEEIWCEEWIDA